MQSFNKSTIKIQPFTKTSINVHTHFVAIGTSSVRQERKLKRKIHHYQAVN